MHQLEWKRSPEGKHYHREDMQHYNCFHSMLSCHLHTHTNLVFYAQNPFIIHINNFDKVFLSLFMIDINIVIL